MATIRIVLPRRAPRSHHLLCIHLRRQAVLLLLFCWSETFVCLPLGMTPALHAMTRPVPGRLYSMTKSRNTRKTDKIYQQ